MPSTLTPARRDVICGLGLGAATLFAGATARAASPPSNKDRLMSRIDTPAARDFDFLHGVWKVRHRKLKHRLANDDAWEEFDGGCACRPMHFAPGNFEDHVIEQPGATYAAAATRYLDPQTGRWSIYWIDSRFTHVEPPVQGSFTDGVGTFIADDTFNDKPIKVRFIWSEISKDAAKWEQAFSPDGGASWESNWVMRFTRVA